MTPEDLRSERGRSADQILEFEFAAEAHAPAGTRLGVGVTAIDERDALDLVAHRVFGDGPLPRLRRVREGVDISTLDAGHVLPNMGSPHVLGSGSRWATSPQLRESSAMSPEP